MTQVDELTQLNVRLHRTLVAQTKRLAAKKGVGLSTYVADLLSQEVDKAAQSLRQQIEAEQAEAQRAAEAMLADLKDREARNERRSKE